MEEPQYAIADLSQPADTQWRGFIDYWDLLMGVTGWALATHSPLEPVRLEMTVGGIPFHRTQTGIARSDIDSLLGVRVTPGFHIDAAVFGRLARLRSRRHHLPVQIRFAGTQIYLPGLHETPTVGSLVAAWRQLVVGSYEEPRSQINGGDRLLARLAAMRGAAESFRALPLRPSNEQQAGHIEAFHVGAAGKLWFIGWTFRGAETEFSALIIDRQKYPGGAATLHFERQDLASRHVGMIGVIDTTWSPPAAIGEFFVYFGPEAQWQLRVGAQTTIVGLDAFFSFFKAAQASLIAGNADSMTALLTARTHWLPGNAAGMGIAAEASLDRLLMVLGFGCIAEGWAICPAKTISTFEIKIGDCVLIADDASTYFRPRPDLGAIYGGGRSLVARGGFVAVFRGELPKTVNGAPLLRVMYSDGVSTVHALEIKLLHQLNFESDSTEVLRLYPSLRHEPCYPALLAAIQRQLTEGRTPPKAFKLNPVQRVIVMRLPAGSGNRRLCFDFIARFGFTDDPSVGLCLLADNSEGLAEVKTLFNELPDRSTSVSLYCIDDADEGFTALPAVLAQLGADRFVYVGRGAALTSRGWHDALYSLRRAGQRVDFFEFVDDLGAPDRNGGVLSAACFGWTTASLFAWLPSSLRLVRGVRSINGLPAPASREHRFSSGAVRLEHPVPSQLADMIDEDILSLRSQLAAADV